MPWRSTAGPPRCASRPTPPARRTKPSHDAGRGSNWLSVNCAPCGSRTSAVRVHSVSSRPRTAPPSRSAVAAAASRSATVKLTCQCGVSPSPACASQPTASSKPGGAPSLLTGPDLGVDRGLEVVAVPGPADHRPETEVVEGPAEDVGVEGGGLSGVGRVEVAEVPAPGTFTTWAPRRRRACQRRNCTPAGSTHTAKRPPSPASVGGCRRRPPAASTRAAAASASSTAT